MNTYLVGGAVRDTLLGLEVRERDWVVVGATPEEMLAEGYKQIGKEFPVFLHPDTNEEYALARTEKKTGPGYRGFSVLAGPDVSLEEDLQRRDLTINAMAQAPDGTIIDPYGGQKDLSQGLLRHVSPAFAEDPVRILRVARFAARFARWGFHVAHGTNALMQQMTEQGEVDHLVPERVWAELVKVLQQKQPIRFFEVLRGCGALQRLFPEIDRLFGVAQAGKHHPVIDADKHILMVLQQAVELSGNSRVRFAALLHDAGKTEIHSETKPDHIGLEEKSVQLINDFCARYKVPKNYHDLALMVARYHSHCHRALELGPAATLDMLDALDAFRRPERFEEFLLICKSDACGQGDGEEKTYPQAKYLRGVLATAAAITAGPLVKQGLKGEAVGLRLRELRIKALKTAREQYQA